MYFYLLFLIVQFLQCFLNLRVSLAQIRLDTPVFFKLFNAFNALLSFEGCWIKYAPTNPSIWLICTIPSMLFYSERVVHSNPSSLSPSEFCCCISIVRYLPYSFNPRRVVGSNPPLVLFLMVQYLRCTFNLRCLLVQIRQQQLPTPNVLFVLICWFNSAPTHKPQPDLHVLLFVQ